VRKKEKREKEKKERGDRGSKSWLESEKKKRGRHKRMEETSSIGFPFSFLFPNKV